MNDRDDRANRLQTLLSAMLQEDLRPAEVTELRTLLKSDPQMRRQYLRQMLVHAMLQWISASQVKPISDKSGALSYAADDDAATSAVCEASNSCSRLPTIVLDESKSSGSGWSSIGLSYTVAALVVAVALLIASQRYLIRQDRNVAVTPDTVAMIDSGADHDLSPAVLGYVARVSSSLDCRRNDMPAAPAQGEWIPTGHRYSFDSGLMEITYNSGTKVILEGPCTFEASSAERGYLARGKATVHVATTMLKSATREDEGQYNRPPDSGSSPPAALSKLFAIETPTAILTDLGTEFAVEVDPSGNSRTHVFQGKVDVRPTKDTKAGAIILRENETARVARTPDSQVQVTRVEGNSWREFVRTMPKRVPIRIFGTGAGLKVGEPDPHWQVIARSSDKQFQPRPAMVFEPVRRVSQANGKDVLEQVFEHGVWLANDPPNSRWISLAQETIPFGEVVTFKTTFDLTGLMPQSVEMEGQYIADDQVAAVRLNGHPWRVAPEAEGRAAFTVWHVFQVPAGHFVAGENSLEVDVRNLALPDDQRQFSGYLAFRAQLKGTALTNGRSESREALGNDRSGATSARK